MIETILPLALPFGFALALAAVLRLLGGTGSGARMAGVAVPAGFLAAWAWYRGLTLSPDGLLGLTAHFALGGALLGLLLDATGRGPRLRAAAGAVFLAVCAWASLGTPTALPGSQVARVEFLILAVVLAVVWAVTLWRLERHHPVERGASGVSLLVALAAGAAMVAAIADAAPVLGPSLGLAAAAAGFLAVAWPMRLPLGAAATFGGAGAILGLAQGLGASWPGTIAPLAVLALALWAGPTARRLPGPEVLRPLWTLALALLPAGLAAVVALAGQGP